MILQLRQQISLETSLAQTVDIRKPGTKGYVHGPGLQKYGLSITDLDAAVCLVADSGLGNNSPEPLVLAQDPAYRHTTAGITNLACTEGNFEEGTGNCKD